MHEEFGTILNRGFNSWVRNLNICIPFILNFLINLILYFFFFGLMGLLLFTSNTGSIIDPATLSQTEIYTMVAKGLSENIALSVFLVLIFSLFGMFVQSFFTAGAIGMAKKASETGDTVLSDMLISGSKNIFRLFPTTLLISLLLLVGIIFMVPGAFAVGDLSTLVENPDVSGQGVGALVMGAFLWSVYIIVMNLVLSLTSYALVIDELGPLEALSASFGFFRNNKLDVFFIWVISIGLAIINSLAGEFIGSENILVAAVTSLVPFAVLQPLTAVLWTRLYLSRKGNKLYSPSDLLSYPDRF
ncbi:hypothetical protein RG963_13225 [Methanosarcina sp. Z-7115]|uniref:DUF7847 domain-containing protein n=1 Tax=Methanosarcina baikalica TaxID=3073890 RepID=A0ABU2D461_9EURY|nr:hypothetical protein [Methanosarcina sp. Z-7115]MCO5381246.1 hypothetical protein [Methanosarcina sp. ERenArc_MAG2]MDR7666722.1 hypothetical protein [Methanosarcina sp. Z-7115]